MGSKTSKNDRSHDLVLTRVVKVPRALIWKAWTEPEHLKKWFTPAPWETVDCQIDLRPGGIFRTVMRSPEGQEHSNVGCYLEIIKNERLVWTDALGPGYRPSAKPFVKEIWFLTAILTFEEHEEGTKYTARALHKDAAGSKTHAAMGFHEGWGKALDQLVAIADQIR